MNRKLLFLLGAITVVFVGGIVLLRGNSPTLRIGQLWPDIELAAREQGFEPSLIAALAYTESKGNPLAVSSSGAVGLLQLKPAAATDAAQKISLPSPSREDLLDPRTNLRLGAAYLRILLERFQGDLDLAIMAYFLGPGGVEREIERFGGAEAMKEGLAKKSGGPVEYLAQVKDHESRFR